MAAMRGTGAGSAALQHRKAHGKSQEHCISGRINSYLLYLQPPHQGTGWGQLLSSEMEVRKLIGKSLQPARPIRRVLPHKAPLLMANFQAEIMDCCKERNNNHSLWCSIGQLNGIVKDPVIPKSPRTPQKTPANIKQDPHIDHSTDHSCHSTCPAKQCDIPHNSGYERACDELPSLLYDRGLNSLRDRITYSRDFLLQLSGMSMCKQKPKYLPDLPVILEHPEIRDINTLHRRGDAATQPK
ncbi:uncharacterized protein C8orf88 homolog isoform X2 [Lithobates pipiens]